MIIEVPQGKLKQSIVVVRRRAVVRRERLSIVEAR